MKRAMLFSVFIKVYMQYTIYYVIFYAIHVLAMSVGYNSLSTHVNYNLFCIAQKEMQDYQSTTTIYYFLFCRTIQNWVLPGSYQRQPTSYYESLLMD